MLIPEYQIQICPDDHNRRYRKLFTTRRVDRTSISLGPGIQDALRSGDLDANELRQSIFAQSDWPASLRGSMLSEIDKATLKPGKERWVGDTVFKGGGLAPMTPAHVAPARNTRNAVEGDNIAPFQMSEV